MTGGSGFQTFIPMLCIYNKLRLHAVMCELVSKSVLSISFEVDVPTGKVGGSLFFECRRHKLPRGVWGHAPAENFEI